MYTIHTSSQATILCMTGIMLKSSTIDLYGFIREQNYPNSMCCYIPQASLSLCNITQVFLSDSFKDVKTSLCDSLHNQDAGKVKR